jgi:hypothetical protein
MRRMNRRSFLLPAGPTAWRSLVAEDTAIA